jgi:2'-5' RNA ligase
MPRLFLGSFLTTEQQSAFAHLKEINCSLDGQWQYQIRWVNSSKLHLTWLFLGQVELAENPELLEKVSGLLAANQLERPLSITYDRLEAWSVQAAPRHLVLTPSQPSKQFLELAQQVRDGLGDFVANQAKQQASKELKPHLTLMRLNSFYSGRAEGQNSPDENGHPLSSQREMRANELSYLKIVGLADLLPLVHKLETISLIESYNDGDSHKYRILKQFPLSQGRSD